MVEHAFHSGIGTFRAINGKQDFHGISPDSLELAQHQINVVNVAPGAINTPINEKTLSDPEKKLALKREIPLGRVGEPSEVANLVCYLASDDASYITGTTVVN